jgi:TolB-like protein/DNA-binding winged helix-turn-helix (wHTH) protein
LDTPVGETYDFESFRLDRSTGRLFRKSAEGEFAAVAIGSRAIVMLGVLVAHAGEVVSRQEIMDAVWQGTAVEESNLTVQLSALRRVLDSGPAEVNCIQSVPGRGYRFVAQVMRSNRGAATTAIVDAPNPAGGTGANQRRLTRGGAAWLLLGVFAFAGLVVFQTGMPDRLHGPGPGLSVVVLPFANLDSDPEQEYFADAITDDLTTDLSRISASVVIAHSTAQSYRGKTLDVRRIGQEVDVHYVLEGSVRRLDRQVEMNAQLIDARTGGHVWADRFESDRRDLAQAQNEITGRIARTLHLELVEVAGRRIERENRVDPDAGDLVMRGWDLWFRPLSTATHEAAAGAFERALRIDPHMVDAKIGVATILISNIGTGLSHTTGPDGARGATASGSDRAGARQLSRL